MRDPATSRHRRRRVVGWLGAWVAAASSLLALLSAGGVVQRLADQAHTWWWRGYGTWPSGGVAHRMADLLGHAAMAVVPATLAVALVAATLLVPVGVLARFGARGRVRAGLGDPLERVRAWIARHAGWMRVLTAAPAAALASWIAWTTFVMSGFGHNDDMVETLANGSVWAILGVAAAAALTALSRAGVRALLAPHADADLSTRTAVGHDEITFDAVAVTPETRAAVAGMGGLALVASVLVAVAPLRGATPLIGTVAYLAIALAGTAAFRRASRIAVGVDGVLVKGTSRTRFFAYRELDGARAEGSDIELLRRDRVMVRLQLHGDDVARREAILARVRDSIEHARATSDARATNLAASSTAAQLARSAGGGADYRTASLTRDELWALVEGPSIDGATRAAAAAALVRTGDDAQRARLRVVAESCAEPRTRVALHEVAELDTGDPFEPLARRALAPR
jgi:hypothetical protein